jgi:hypothetical protein
VTIDDSKDKDDENKNEEGKQTTDDKKNDSGAKNYCN